MKNGLLILAPFLCVLLLSCSEMIMDEGRSVAGRPIEFAVRAVSLSMSVKASMDAPDSFYVSAVEGGESVPVWHNELFSGMDRYTGRIYWPSSDPSYSFFASNVPMSTDTTAIVLRLENTDNDVICSYLPADSVSFGELNRLSFSHILCAVGSAAEISAESGCTVDSVEISFLPDTSGVYNMESAAWNERCCSTVKKDWTPGMLFLPGSYGLDISWTATKGAESRRYSKTLPPLEFQAGTSVNLMLRLGMNCGQLNCSGTIRRIR